MLRINGKRLVVAVLLTLISSVNMIARTATNWTVDTAHTSINFKIMHFFTPIHGSFDDFDIDLNFDPDNLEGSMISVSIQTASINTNHGPRDQHLKTADWFDSEAYPEMTFKSSEIRKKGDDAFIAKGKLKIRDVEKDIELSFKLLGVRQVPDDMENMVGGNNEVAGFEASYTVNREDYNVGAGTSRPGKAASMYRQSVGKEVNINIAVEAYRKTF